MGKKFVTAGLFLVTCTASLPLHAAVEGAFQLTRLDEESWSANYCYATPVDAIRFERPFKGLRENSWSVEDKAFVLTFTDDTAELRRTDGGDFRCATVMLETYTVMPEKDYYAFSPFSDGGVSVYTGHLMGPVLVDGEWQETVLDARYTARMDENVVTREPERLVHQFVYFGKQPMLATEGVVAVIDPAVPGKARAGILASIPAVTAMLEQDFDFVPRSPYTVFMAMQLDASDGYSIKGGVQPDQILFTLKGGGVASLVEKNPAQLPKLTAHEVLHLWQVEHWFDLLGNDHPWVHEGSADALAIELMRKTGVFDAASYAGTWQSIENECAKALNKTSIHAAPEVGRFDAVYSCGALINRLVGEVVNPENPGEGIIEFWQAMAAWPESDRKVESEKLFFRTLEKLGFGDEQRTVLRNFLDLQADEPQTAIERVRATLKDTE